MARLVEFARFLEPEEAYVVQSLLRARGIDSIIQNEHHSRADPALRFALGGFGILIIEDFLDEATQAVQNIETDLTDDEDSDPIVWKEKNWCWIPIALNWGIPFIPEYRTQRVNRIQIAIATLIYIPIAYNIYAMFVTWLSIR